MTASYRWDADDYARSSSGQQVWARELIAKLHLRGDERVLDLGSGDGKVSAELASHLSTGSVLGVDNSPEMIALAERRYPPMQHPNLRFRLVDARALPFRGEFDVVFSNATLHWIREQSHVLHGIAASLKSGWRILLQMGGRGNASTVVAAMDHVRTSPRWRNRFIGFEFPYGFYAPEEYAPWLEAAGLKPVRVQLLHKDMVHPDRAAFAGWLRTTWLPYTQRVDEKRRAIFLAQVADEYLRQNPASPDGTVHVDMRRLEVEANKEN